MKCVADFESASDLGMRPRSLAGANHGSCGGRSRGRIGSFADDASDRAAQQSNAYLLRASHVARGDVSALPFPNGSFDRALTVHTVYFWHDDDQAFLELARALRPGGSLVVAFRFDAAAMATFPAAVYEWKPPEAIERVASMAGFVVRAVQQRQDASRTMYWVVAQRVGD